MTRAEIPPGEYKYASGWFDPLGAAHVRQLLDLSRQGPLVVVINDPPSPILPPRARAELVAALDCVSYVVIGGDAPVKLEAGHQTIYEELVRHVERRHKA